MPVCPTIVQANITDVQSLSLPYPSRWSREVGEHRGLRYRTENRNGHGRHFPRFQRASRDRRVPKTDCRSGGCLLQSTAASDPYGYIEDVRLI
jgi:hypothetical protein